MTAAGNNVSSTPEDRTAAATTTSAARDQNQVQESKSGRNALAGGNILVRFYKRYVMDDYGHDFDCDNFSKL